MVKAKILSTGLYTELYFENKMRVKYTENSIISIDFFEYGKIYCDYPEVDFPDSFLDNITSIFETCKEIIKHGTTGTNRF